MGKMVTTCELCGKSVSQLQKCKLCGAMVCQDCLLQDVSICRKCARKGLWIEEP